MDNHFCCLGILSTAIIKGMIYWSYSSCTPIFTAKLSALEKIMAVERKLDCVDNPIRERSTAIINGKIYWSYGSCTPIFTAKLSALEKIMTVERKLDCVDTPIREMTMLRNEIELIKSQKSFFYKLQKVDLTAIETTVHKFAAVLQ